jgi:hypothetical protein
MTEEDKRILDFINNTDEVLIEIEKSNDGEKTIQIINSVFCDKSAQDFAKSFALINEEKSNDYLEYIENNFNGSFENNSELILVYNIPCNNRGAYSADLEWDTIGWYTGFCVSTIAGFFMMSYGNFWLRIAGAVAATAGTASMVIQLKNWIDCSDLKSFILSLFDKDIETSNKLLNGETGIKLAAITTETVATVAACAFLPAGKLIIKYVVHYYNLIIEKILTVLPSGINFIFNGIPIKLIVL